VNHLASESYVPPFMHVFGTKYTETNGESRAAEDSDETAFLIDDYESNREGSSNSKTADGALAGLSAQTLKVLSQYVQLEIVKHG
jgi:hypothetical protein